MKRSQMFLALCAIAVGKTIINPGEKIPDEVSEGKIKALLANGSIEPAAEEFDNTADVEEAARVEALIKRATELGITDAISIKTEALEAMVAEAEEKAKAVSHTEKLAVADSTTITGDGSGQALPNASNTEHAADGVDGEMTAILTGAVTQDGRVVELKELSAAALKKLAGELGIAGAAQMKKEALVEAITAVEFAADK